MALRASPVETASRVRVVQLAQSGFLVIQDPKDPQECVARSVNLEIPVLRVKPETREERVQLDPWVPRVLLVFVDLWASLDPVAFQDLKGPGVLMDLLALKVLLVSAVSRE